MTLPGTVRERAFLPSMFDWGVTYAWATKDTMQHEDLVDRFPSKSDAETYAQQVQAHQSDSWGVQVVVRQPGGQWVTRIGTPVREYRDQVRAYAEGRSTHIPG